MCSTRSRFSEMPENRTFNDESVPSDTVPEYVSDQKKKSEVSSDQNKDSNIDSLFADFMASVKDKPVPSRKKVKSLPGFLFEDGQDHYIETAEDADDNTENEPITFAEVEYGAADEECERLTSKPFVNFFKVFKLSVRASDGDIRRAFKKLSLIVHPDKCQNPKAQDAFQVLNKAYEELQKPNMKKRYTCVYAEAKKRVIANIKIQNKARKLNKEEPLSTKEDDVQDQISEMCEQMIEELEENEKYADKCRKANEQWETQYEEILQEEADREEKRKIRWDETRDARVEDWREFREDVQTHKLKAETFQPFVHKREQRKVPEKGKSSKPKGIDESYKQNWR